MKFEETPKPSKEQKLSIENIESAVQRGKNIEVKIKRSSGEIEDGWKIIRIDSEGLATVYKVGENGEELSKNVPLEELRQWNAEE